MQMTMPHEHPLFTPHVEAPLVRRHSAPAQCGRLDPSDPEYARIRREAVEADERDREESGAPTGAAATTDPKTKAPEPFIYGTGYLGRITV